MQDTMEMILLGGVTPFNGAPHIHFFPSSAMILLVVWSANGDGSALTSMASSKVNLLNDDTYQWDCDRNCVILQTNRARCILNREIHDLLNEESVSGES